MMKNLLMINIIIVCCVLWNNNSFTVAFIFPKNKVLLQPSWVITNKIVGGTFTTTTTAAGTTLTKLSLSKKGNNKNDDDDDESDDAVTYEFYRLKNNRYDYNREVNLEWLMKRYKFPKAKLETLGQHHRQFLSLENSVLEGRANWLQETLDLTNKQMNDIIRKNPKVLTNRIDTNVAPTLTCLETALKLDKEELKKLVLRSSIILQMCKEDIGPKIEYLKSRHNLDDLELRRIVMKFPQILGLDIEENIRPKIDWLQDRLKLTDEELSKNIKRHPSVFGLNIRDNIEPTLEWIQQRLSLTDAGLSNLMLLQPQLLGCNVPENLAPTIEFYIEAADVEEGDVITLLGKRPRLLAAGLPRLKHRLKEARGAGLLIDAGCLDRMATYQPKRWATSLGFQQRKLDKGGGKKDELW